MCSDDIKTLDITQFMCYNLIRQSKRFSLGKMVRIDTEYTQKAFIKGFLNINECFIAFGNLIRISIECAWIMHSISS